MVKITHEFLMKCATSRVGTFNKKQIELLGLSYPPLAGWKGRLIGKEIPESIANKVEQAKGERTKHAIKYHRKLERLAQAKARGEV